MHQLRSCWLLRFQDHKPCIDCWRAHMAKERASVLLHWREAQPNSQNYERKIYRINGKDLPAPRNNFRISSCPISRRAWANVKKIIYALSSDSVAKKPTTLHWQWKPLLAEKVWGVWSSQRRLAVCEKTAGKSFAGGTLNINGLYDYMKRPGCYRGGDDTLLTVTNTAFDNSLLAVDAFRQALNEKSVKEIRHSFIFRKHITLWSIIFCKIGLWKAFIWCSCW